MPYNKETNKSLICSIINYKSHQFIYSKESSNCSFSIIKQGIQSFSIWSCSTYHQLKTIWNETTKIGKTMTQIPNRISSESFPSAFIAKSNFFHTDKPWPPNRPIRNLLSKIAKSIWHRAPPPQLVLLLLSSSTILGTRIHCIHSREPGRQWRTETRNCESQRREKRPEKQGTARRNGARVYERKGMEAHSHGRHGPPGRSGWREWLQWNQRREKAEVLGLGFFTYNPLKL